jgi:hypothetical protein
MTFPKLHTEKGADIEARRDAYSWAPRLRTLMIGHATHAAAAMGPDWTPWIFYNAGWHAYLRSRCGRWTVHINTNATQRHKVVSFSAFLNERGEDGGQFVEQGKTPQQAVRRTQTVALARLRQIEILTDSPPPMRPVHATRSRRA